MPLKVALDTLVNNYELNIVYRDQIVSGVYTSGSCNNCSPGEAISALLEATDLEWKRNQSQYIIIHKSKDKMSDIKKFL